MKELENWTRFFFFFFSLRWVQWPSAGSMEVFQQIHFNLAGKLAHGHCCLQAVIHNGRPQNPVQSRGSFLHFLIVGVHVFLLLWFYFISQHGLCLEVFCSLVWRYIVGVTVETQRAEQGIETSKGLLSAEAGGVYKLALLASSWARWFVWRGEGDEYLFGCIIPKVFCMGA